MEANNKKFELTDETMEWNDHTLHRIKAAKDFYVPNYGLIKKDTLGGWVESEKNLSQNEGCWIFHDAKVYGGNAKVYGDAFITGCAKVYDSAKVFGEAYVHGDSEICGNAEIRGYAEIFDAIVRNNADYIVFKNHFSSGRYFTWTKSNDMWIAGCFHGNDNELIAKAYADSLRKGEYYKAYVDFKNSLLKLDEKYGKVDKNF